ncbi:COX assembly mitochondrial protein homolog isoform X2 [Carcharodon carcharias]|uniref:COX assembly mitochondrial protein homolog isoform X2 n=1 Tax=Carcharodon carcharias TaxID=13397 RepID=UPI001B7E75D1|nr:COX assembly mitochondrial protein homolog isoform X2 [Carcharodon carcharias]
MGGACCHGSSNGTRQSRGKSTSACGERCSYPQNAFTKCCQDKGFLMVVKCREENAALKECLTYHYKDAALYEECKQEYLKEREEFRQTGIPSKKRQQKVSSSM